MIVRITGTLTDTAEDHAVIERDGIAYEIMICNYALQELTACLGREVTLHILEYFEGSTMGGNLIPRMVGFLHPEDRSFFNRFITVKGMGVRKAIKALAEPVARIAAAIEEGNEAALARLPGIGKRGAAQIIAELRGKVALFATAATEPAPEPAETWTTDQQDALKILVALGERRSDAARWLARAGQLHPDTTGCDEWVRLAYQIRSMEA